MPDENDFPVWKVLEHFPQVPVDRLEYLAGHGGFSGARLWRCRGTGGIEPVVAGPSHPSATVHCLRRWPSAQSEPRRLLWSHRILALAWNRGCRILPVPYLSADGTTLVTVANHAWELAPWMPGAANYAQHPTDIRRGAAMQALAQFHQAARLPNDGAAAHVGGPLPPTHGAAQKLETLEKFRLRRVSEIETALQSGRHPPDAALAYEMLELFRAYAPRVAIALQQVLPLSGRIGIQPCIGDIWHDHVLFLENQVTGIVDFGAMRMDNVSTDVARLLGSLVRNDHEHWQHGLDTYAQSRPLSDSEIRVAQASHLATLLLSGMNWLYWLWVEERQFDDMERVAARLLQCRDDQRQIGAWLQFFTS